MELSQLFTGLFQDVSGPPKEDMMFLLIFVKNKILNSCMNHSTQENKDILIIPHSHWTKKKNANTREKSTFGCSGKGFNSSVNPGQMTLQ